MVTKGGTSREMWASPPTIAKAPHATELVYSRAAGKKGPRAHRHVAGQHHVVGQDHVIAQAAIVGHVGVAHQQAMIADHRIVVRLHGLVDRDILADRVARADDHPAEPVGHVGMLGNAADDRTLEEMVFFAQRGPALDDDVALQDTLRADRHVVLDDAKGSNLNAIAKFCRRSNQRQRVNTHVRYLEAVESFPGARCDPAAGQVWV